MAGPKARFAGKRLPQRMQQVTTPYPTAQLSSKRLPEPIPPTPKPKLKLTYKLKDKWHIRYGEESKAALAAFELELKEQFAQLKVYPDTMRPQKRLIEDSIYPYIMQSIETGIPLGRITRYISSSPTPSPEPAPKSSNQGHQSRNISPGTSPTRAMPVVIGLITPSAQRSRDIDGTKKRGGTDEEVEVEGPSAKKAKGWNAVQTDKTLPAENTVVPRKPVIKLRLTKTPKESIES